GSPLVELTQGGSTLAGGLASWACVDPFDREELPWILIWEVAQKNRVDDAEYGRADTDTERHQKNGDQRESRSPLQLPERIPKVSAGPVKHGVIAVRVARQRAT